MEGWHTRVRELTLALIRLPSVTNTDGETEFAWRLHDLLLATPYFRDHPELLRVERTVDDLHERSNLYALVRGAGPGTVVLAGHYDVVAVDNYGGLQPWSFDPEALLPRLIADLARDASSEGDRRALEDFRTGDFLPGRGALDMKSGLAAGIAVLERFATLPSDRRGNLLLVATPDEEEASHGMRSAARRLPELARLWGLDLVAAINLDATDDQGDGNQGRAVFLGSVGKLLPSVFVVGRDTHAGSPFAGVNANLIAAEVTRRVECNVDLADVGQGEVAPPPVSLKQIDLKAYYDVTTPASAWCYFNVLTHGRPPRAVLERFIAAVQEAMDAALAYLGEQERRFRALRGSESPPPVWQPRVLSFAELRAHVIAGDPAAGRELEALGRDLAQDMTLDTPALCRRIVEAWWARSRLAGPAGIVGFAGLHYPVAFAGEDSARHRRVRDAVERQAFDMAREQGQSIRLRPFFPGISDMSFLGGALDSVDEQVVVDNTPASGARLRLDYGVIRALGLPVVNVGPWGRDYHQRTERVYAPYAFGVVPELIWRIAGALLDETTMEL